jgi:hypothetical protein
LSAAPAAVFAVAEEKPSDANRVAFSIAGTQLSDVTKGKLSPDITALRARTYKAEILN